MRMTARKLILLRVETHPTFARVRMSSGVEKYVSLRHLAPLPSGPHEQSEEDITCIYPPSVSGSAMTPGKFLHPVGDSTVADPVTPTMQAAPNPPVSVERFPEQATTDPTVSAPRRSTRESRVPERLGYQQLENWEVDELIEFVIF